MGVLEQTLSPPSTVGEWFQSLEGIWGFWNNRATGTTADFDSFQSLEGIWGFWNKILPMKPPTSICFNPWKGFGGFGTRLFLKSIAASLFVSIPGRDLGVLERGSRESKG